MMESECQNLCCIEGRKNACSRCGVAIDTSKWENGWPNTGELTVQRHSQMFVAIRRHQHRKHHFIADKDDFTAWKIMDNHPAILDASAQRLDIRWGPDESYTMCKDCQDKFLALIGEFFKVK